MSYYRILSLDGGGLHGYAHIIIIKRLLDKFPNLLNDVDLIAGTSIGGILALGLASGHHIDDVDKNFVKGFPIAFTTNLFRLIGFYIGFCSKYNSSKFKTFLNDVYGDSRLEDLKKRVVIPTYCLDDEASANRRWRAKIFHNFPGLDSDEESRVVDVAMSTSAAPVYFPIYGKYIDGAMIANNPTLCAITQTQDIRNLERSPTEKHIVVLSLGSIRDIHIKKRDAHWGYFSWARYIFNMITERDTLVVNHIGKMILGDRYCRVEPIINGMMDDLDELPIIKARGNDQELDNVFRWLEKYWVMNS